MARTATARPAACRYTVGQQVEILHPDFTKPGFPKVWWPAEVKEVNRVDTPSAPRGGLWDVMVIIAADGRPFRTLVGPRGGNNGIRPAVSADVKAGV